MESPACILCIVNATSRAAVGFNKNFPGMKSRVGVLGLLLDRVLIVVLRER